MILQGLGWYALTHIPLWVWFVAAGVILAALYGVWHLGLRQLLWVGALLAIGLIFPAAARAGWRAKEQADWNAANKAIDRATDARKKQMAKDEDPKNLRNDDGFRRD